MYGELTGIVDTAVAVSVLLPDIEPPGQSRQRDHFRPHGAVGGTSGHDEAGTEVQLELKFN